MDAFEFYYSRMEEYDLILGVSDKKILKDFLLQNASTESGDIRLDKMSSALKFLKTMGHFSKKAEEIILKQGKYEKSGVK